MEQIKIILQRLKNPSVIMSIVSQIITILVLLNVNVDKQAVTGVVTAICTILVLLGILSNPDTNTKGYGDDMIQCDHCNKLTKHVLVNGKMVCSECGNENSNKSENNDKDKI